MLPWQVEVAKHRDILVIRGIDTYLALPDKVTAMMKYAFSSPKGKKKIELQLIYHLVR